MRYSNILTPHEIKPKPSMQLIALSCMLGVSKYFTPTNLNSEMNKATYVVVDIR